MFVLENHTC